MSSFSTNPNREPLAPPSKPTGSHEGGHLADFAVHGTTLPTSPPTQRIVPSARDPRSHAIHAQSTGHADLVGCADNVTAQPESTQARDWNHETSEVVTGTGDAMPKEAEMKYVGGGSAGGKEREKGVLKARGQPHD